MLDKVVKLPVLDALVSAFEEECLPNIDDIVFVCTQHLLVSLVPLFEALIGLGAEPTSIFLIGKQYSACEHISQQLRDMGIQIQKLSPLQELGNYKPIFDDDLLAMWEGVRAHVRKENPRAIIVLDDGGRSLDFVAKGVFEGIPVVGIEQTTAGLFNSKILSSKIPFIDVAGCPAKTKLESPIISYEVLRAVKAILPPAKFHITCGVIGLGTIGMAVVKQLQTMGHAVLIFDKNRTNYDSMASACCLNGLDELVMRSDYIFGCTGRDSSQALFPEKHITKDTTFISCSSEDKEFLSLLLHIDNNSTVKTWESPLDDIAFQLKNGATLRVLNGGFPVNFNREQEYSSPYLIQLTRGLLLGALIQAILLLEQPTKLPYGRIALNSEVQRFIVECWQNDIDHLLAPIIQLLSSFDNTQWILNNSLGNIIPIKYFEKCCPTKKAIQFPRKKTYTPIFDNMASSVFSQWAHTHAI